ncbi:MAG: hypothetical protein NDI88_14810 [Lysobacter sp.]|nr:hypothetical protein [Lysobacter sp.]
MADPRDERVSAAYRDLPGEGPSPSLDAAIQAAARRAVGSRPAAGRRWQKPLSIAAVFMLAIAVSLQVEREKPIGVDEGAPASTGSAEYPVPQADTEPAAPASKPAAPAPAKRTATPEPAPRENEAARQAGRPPSPALEAKRIAPAAPAPSSPPAAEATPLREEPAPRASAPPSSPAPAAAPPAAAFSAPAASGAAVSRDAVRAAPQAAPRAKSELAREATTQEKRMADALDTPERRLERIAGLRLRGLHDEADRELAEFRRAFPDYRISEEWLGKVQRK